MLTNSVFALAIPFRLLDVNVSIFEIINDEVETIRSRWAPISEYIDGDPGSPILIGYLLSCVPRKPLNPYFQRYGLGQLLYPMEYYTT